MARARVMAQEAGDDWWTLWDTKHPHGTDSAALGIIHKTDAGFELMIGNDVPQLQGTYPTLDAAVSAATP